MTHRSAIILAAGKGTRMKSPLPKVLHSAAGRPLVYYPVRAALDAGCEEIVVVVSPNTESAVAAELTRLRPGVPLAYAVQKEARGTGDAARAGLEVVSGRAEEVLILSGDTPLLQGSDLERLVRARREVALVFASFVLPDPTGYGRVLRDAKGQVTEIREHKDLTSPEQRAVSEVNAGLYFADVKALRSAVQKLTPNNAQGEYYLTDVVRLLSGAGVATVPMNEEALRGVNHRGELSLVERILHERIRQKWAELGVTIVGAPLIDDAVQIGADAVIEDGVRLRGVSTIGEGARIDVGCVIDDSSIGAGAHLKPYSVATQSEVGAKVQLGPFAHLRPGSVLEDEAHIGNFVETKNTRVRKGAKANHLAYLGDGDIGERANIGAGTIFCNYDGFMKHKTVIGAGAFIGSDSQIVAPVTVGPNAYVGTGTTVTKDVPEDALAIGRVRQSNKEGYGAMLRERLKAEKARKG